MKKYLQIVLLLCLTAGCKSHEVEAPLPLEESVHLKLGNPTNAKTDDVAGPDNFLMVRQQYALSYNRAKGHANWVSWELSNQWMGASDQQDDFWADPTLPGSWYKVQPNDYANSGFDMGSLCPSGDRTKSVVDVSATYLMTNIIPIAPALNRQAWTELEVYSRSLVAKGYRLYMIAGAYGTGGVGSKGVALKIRNTVNVPTRIYKIIVAIPNDGTVDQIKDTTPVIAVDFPNWSGVANNKSWTDFVTSPEAIERNAGVSFFTSLPEQQRNSLRAARFNPDTTPLRFGIHRGSSL